MVFLKHNMLSVRTYLFVAVLINAVVAISIGLGAFYGFSNLNTGITELTSKLFPAVVSSSKVERQHQRIMRTLFELSAAQNDLEKSIISQQLKDLFAGQKELLEELSAQSDEEQKLKTSLSKINGQIEKVTNEIDKKVTSFIQLQLSIEGVSQRINDIRAKLAEHKFDDSNDINTFQSNAIIERVIHALANMEYAENEHILSNLKEEIDLQLHLLNTYRFKLSDETYIVVDGIYSQLKVFLSESNSIFDLRSKQLAAKNSIRGLLSRADQISRISTGLNTGVFVDKTGQAETRRNQIINFTEVYTWMFFGSIGVIVVGFALTMLYIQKKIINRLWKIRQSIRHDRDHPQSLQGDEIAELSNALHFFINETSQKSKALEDNERWLSKVLETAPFPLIIVTKETARTRFINKRALHLFPCLGETEKNPQTLSAIWHHPEDWENFKARILQTGHVRDFETEFQSPRSDVFWGLVSGQTLEYQGEEVYLVSLIDITDRHKAEENLRQAKDQAEKADAAKTDFLATISHEMRTPLNGILGIGRILLEQQTSPSDKKHLKTMMNCGRALLDHVNDLLDLRKIEDGSLELHLAPMDLWGMMDDIETTVQPLAQEKDLEFRLNISKAVPRGVILDEHRMRQILLNLIANAIKFTEKGGIYVYVDAKEAKDDTFELTFIVEDTGIGIPPERIKAIFQKFERADQTISRRFGGSGLGLTISNQLAKAMLGRISVESQLNKGSEFKFSLPAQSTEENQLTAKANTGNEEESRPLKLLLVEDDPVNLEIATTLLENLNHEVTAAQTGYRALELASQHIYDAVLLDIRLPDIDGDQIARQIRAFDDRKLAEVTIIAVTANLFKDDIARYIASGIDDLIEKPILPDRLMEVLSNISSTKKKLKFADDQTDAKDDIINLDILERYFNSLGRERFIKILDQMDKQANSLIPIIQDENSTTEAIGDAAHKIASATCHFGLNDFVNQMRTLEKIADTKNEKEVRERTKDVLQSYETARNALGKWLNQ
ncbi:ATP-binding protein [Terasakiella sp. A23]|uniref:ATP-binding protein n=1 Tax=Terasakiella sp. FCG-A23 TaxID=3080561 RepID=UPI002953BE90|nr:ATP-binding protein [Terasakiella sp. A23]MDV7341251.1 ATP-binding protein [Terasakiella sp. A23]